MKNPIILFRQDLASENELEIAKKYFDIVEYRSEAKNSLVFGRYSTLPYYQELEQDLKNQNCELINTWEQYNWIANFEWYEPLKDYTFKTWFRGVDVPEDEAPFI